MPGKCVQRHTAFLNLLGADKATTEGGEGWVPCKQRSASAQTHWSPLVRQSGRGPDCTDPRSSQENLASVLREHIHSGTAWSPSLLDGEAMQNLRFPQRTWASVLLPCLYRQGIWLLEGPPLLDVCILWKMSKLQG